MTFLDSVTISKALIIPGIAWFIAQFIKLIISLAMYKKLDLSCLFSMGGMPSAHSALVCALATTVAVLDGVNSSTFAIAVLFAIIVMYDAAGVRQTVSEQSNILNRMLDELLRGKPAFEERLRELVGHSRMEVVAGGAIGILLGWFLV